MAVAYHRKFALALKDGAATVLTDSEGRPAMLFGKDDSVSVLDILKQRADDMEERSVLSSQEVDEALSWIEKRLEETFGNNVSLSLDSQTGQLTADAAEDTSVLLQPEECCLPMAPQPDIRAHREFLSLIVNADGTVSLPALPSPSEAYRRSHLLDEWSEGGLTKIERFTSGGAGTVTVTAPVQVNVRPATESPKCLGPKTPERPVGFTHPSTKHKLDDGLSLWGYMGRRK